MQLIEQFCLENPFVLGAATAQAVDAIAQRAVGLAVQAGDQPGGEFAMRFGKRDPLIEVDQVAFVDARRRGIDGDEHFGGEIFAAAVEDHAGDADGAGLGRMLVHVELQRGQAMLSIDDEKLLLRFGQMAHPFGAGKCRDVFRGDGQHDHLISLLNRDGG